MSCSPQQTVLLGPRLDLHAGFHDSLLRDPPAGVSYRTRDARHHFAGLAPQTGGELLPCQRFHLGEFVDFGPGPQVAHSPRWPVLRRRAWVADLDDFGFPFLFGRYGLNPAAPALAQHVRTGHDAGVRQRAANMLAAFAHPSCKAVLFWPRHALQGARGWLSQLDLEEEGRPLLEKSRVLYPAVRPLHAPLVRRKWQHLDGPRVLFVGRDYAIKNGAWALRAFRQLSSAFPAARFTYVGELPVAQRHLAEGLDVRGSLPRDAVLRLFEESHVLFHPAHEESFGLVLLEAAAHGLAVVAGRGRGLPHVEELFPAGEAALVDRDPLRAEDEEAVFAATLRGLLEDPDRARALALAAHRRVLDGELSLETRNRALQAIYREAARDPAPDALEWADLPLGGGAERLALESEALSEGLQAFCRRLGLEGLNFAL